MKNSKKNTPWNFVDRSEKIYTKLGHALNRARKIGRVVIHINANYYISTDDSPSCREMHIERP